MHHMGILYSAAKQVGKGTLSVGWLTKECHEQVVVLCINHQHQLQPCTFKPTVVIKYPHITKNRYGQRLLYAQSFDNFIWIAAVNCTLKEEKGQAGLLTSLCEKLQLKIKWRSRSSKWRPIDNLKCREISLFWSTLTTNKLWLLLAELPYIWAWD